jgi:acyl-CoA synthetase (AMP-forming)/AMP-acid ligase II
MMNVAELLTKQAKDHPGRQAIIDAKLGHRRVFTFGEIQEQVDYCCRTLRCHGVKRGHSVLLVHQISAPLYIALAALLRLGATAVFLDPSANQSFIEACFDLLKIDALITSPPGALLPLFSKPLRRIPLRFTTGAGLPAVPSIIARRGRGVRPAAHVSEAVDCGSSTGKSVISSGHPVLVPDETAALVTFTSGSTGQPKAIVRSHAFLKNQLLLLKDDMSMNEGEIDCTNLPIFVLANLASGITSVIPQADLRAPGDIDAAPVVVQLYLNQVNRMTASPAFLSTICRYCQKHSITLDSLQKIYTGGGPVFPKLLQDLRAIAPNAAIHAVYGSTEAEPIAKIDYRDIAPQDIDKMRHGGGLLVGLPHQRLKVRIERRQEDNAIGEIVVTGKHVIKGYLHGKGDSETKFVADGEIWHRTGDAGYFDDQGRLWLVGRRSAEIKDQFGSIYPFQIESAACERNFVKHAACVAHNGRRTLVLEVLPDQAGSLKLDALRRDLSWAHIDELTLIEKMPVDGRHNSKILYSAVEQHLVDVGNRRSRFGC